MAVHVWAGDPADEGYERSALRELASSLADEQGDYSIFANFTVGSGKESSQIDLLVVHEKAWTIVELKHSAAYAVFGQSNGRWTRSDGIEFPGHNPALQVVKQYSNLRNWLHKNCTDFVEHGRLAACRDAAAWTDIRKFIVLYPCKHPASKIEVSSHQAFAGTLGDVIGFDLLKSHLLEPKWQGSLRLALTPEETSSMAGVLGLRDVTADILGAATSAKTYHATDTKLGENQPPLTHKQDGASATRPEMTHQSRAPVVVLDKRITHRRWTTLVATIALLGLVIGGVLSSHYGLIFARTIEATDAHRFVGRRAVVRVVVGRVDSCGTYSTCIFDQRLRAGQPDNFSVEVVGMSAASFSHEPGAVIHVGPAWIRTSDSDAKNAQIEIPGRDATRLIKKGP